MGDLGEINSSEASLPNPRHQSSFSSSISSSVETSHSLDLTRIFQENYYELKEALAGTVHSWTDLTLTLCHAKETASKLAQSTNSNVKSLLEKVEELDKVIKKGDSAVTAARAVHGSLSQM